MTYQGPQRPWQQPGQQQPGQSPQQPGQPAGYPGNYGPGPGFPPQNPGPPTGPPAYGGHPYGGPPPRKKQGPLVALILGIVILIGAGVGAIFLFTGEDNSGPAEPQQPAKPSSKIDLVNLQQACRFLSADEVSQKTGIKDLKEVEVPRASGGLVAFDIGCQYLTPDNKLFQGFLLRIYEPGTCDPLPCLNMLDLPGKTPVANLGQAAVFFKNQQGRGEIFAVQVMGEIPVRIELVGQGPNTTADDLVPIAQEIFTKLAG